MAKSSKKMSKGRKQMVKFLECMASESIQTDVAEELYLNVESFQEALDNYSELLRTSIKSHLKDAKKVAASRPYQQGIILIKKVYAVSCTEKDADYFISLFNDDAALVKWVKEKGHGMEGLLSRATIDGKVFTQLGAIIHWDHYKN